MLKASQFRKQRSSEAAGPVPRHPTCLVIELPEGLVCGSALAFICILPVGVEVDVVYLAKYNENFALADLPSE
jgi:hypothetical protein